MPARPSLAEIFFVALRLGCTSFGGPVAHLAYFRKEYVERLHWLDEREYADLVALCQFLPGPASSQTGFGVGYLKHGLPGGLVAWVGFTVPSTVLMIAFAYGTSALKGDGVSWLNGLKIASVAVVAQAVWAMAKSFCPDWMRASFAVLAAVIITWFPFAWIQIAILAVAAMLGWLIFRKTRSDSIVQAPAYPSKRRTAFFSLSLFFIFLTMLPVLSRNLPNPWLKVFDRFYRSGALVFGGGHAVLPLLEQEVVAPGWVTHDQFLAGYGAAQAMPGPLFTVSAYLGAVMKFVPEHSRESKSGESFPASPADWRSGLWTLFAIFLPALLLVTGALPFWDNLRHQSGAQAALRGANAAVVGILLAALYNPLATGTITSGRSLSLAVTAFIGLQFAKIPAWAVVLALAALGHWWL